MSERIVKNQDLRAYLLKVLFSTNEGLLNDLKAI